MKECNNCGERKSLTEFKRTMGYVNSVCNTCLPLMKGRVTKPGIKIDVKKYEKYTQFLVQQGV
jgi:hypothetical protein